MSGRRWPGRDRGAFTAELAVGLLALMVLFFAGLAIVLAVTAKGQCLTAAREAALEQARGGSGVAAGERAAPAGAVVELGGDADVVTARVRVRLRVLNANLPVISVEATATAAREPEPVL
ncbi:TadE family type IV pilus minor pilin [Actinoplanes solisilvae]|uniref:TadE family type IV pilus minor pilin n=1 Tax=Actinoplanes solisilvae TaxID=2486853 RepID=UPI000FDB82C8|nr:TadE family type IV pilus minor pilin [Actinoplanes solisilvae]